MSHECNKDQTLLRVFMVEHVAISKEVIKPNRKFIEIITEEMRRTLC